MDGSQSPNAPHLGTLLYHIPNISDAPALLVYPHVLYCSFRLSRRLTETGGWFYVPELTLRGSACGSDLWQHCPVPSPLTRQCFTYFGSRHLLCAPLRHARCTVLVQSCGFSHPYPFMASYNLKMCHSHLDFVLQVQNKPLGAAILPYLKRARA